ncbi:MAG TPA: hypothetical protein VJJ22_02490 [Candidatus Paceibacterota bacterium]
MIELVFAVLILVLLSTAVLSVLKYRDRAFVERFSQETMSQLNLARTRTLASDQDSVYGVHFEEYKTVLFKGSTYSPTAPTNEVSKIGPMVHISSISLKSGSDVVFSRLTGEVANYGSVTLEATNKGSKQQIINITPSGLIYKL